MIDTTTPVPPVQPGNLSSLGQNYPNPFNPTTAIPYAIVRPGRVTLSIYLVDGSLVRRLVDKDKPPGQYQTEWNGRNDSGTRVSSGVYFCRLSVGTTVLSRSMTLLK